MGSSDSKCAAAKWREFIRPLSHRDRAGVWRSYVKKRGSIVVAEFGGFDLREGEQRLQQLTPGRNSTVSRQMIKVRLTYTANKINS